MGGGDKEQRGYSKMYYYMSENMERSESILTCYCGIFFCCAPAPRVFHADFCLVKSLYRDRCFQGSSEHFRSSWRVTVSCSHNENGITCLACSDLRKSRRLTLWTTVFHYRYYISSVGYAVLQRDQTACQPILVGVRNWANMLNLKMCLFKW